MIFWKNSGVLILSEDRAHLYILKRRKLTHAFMMRRPEQLLRLLRRLRLAHISLLFNPIDLYINHVELGSLRWFDQCRLRVNALRRMREESDMMGTLWRKQRLTSITLKETLRLRSWLEGLQASKSAVKGCHLLPIEATALLSFLRPEERQRWIILVSAHDGCIRHSAFKGGHFMMTRCIPFFKSARYEQKLERLHAETIRSTSDYLSNTYGVDETGLRFFLLDGDSPRSELFPANAFNYPLQRLQRLIEKSKITLPVEALFAAAYAKSRRPRMKLRCERLAVHQQRYRTQSVWRRCIFGCALICSMAGLGWVSKIWISSPAQDDLESGKLASYLQKTAPSLSSRFTLDALIVRDKQRWAFWVAGKRYTPETPFPGFTVEDVNAQAISGMWREQGARQRIEVKMKEK